MDNLPMVERPVEASESVELLRTVVGLQRAMLTKLIPILAEGHRLDVRHYMLMRQIQFGAAHPGDLVRKTLATPSQITRQIDRLEDMGLVDRTIDQKDSRKIRLALTAKSRDLLSQIDQDLAVELKPALARLSSAEFRALIQTVETLTGAILA
jgi:DNA-binding MarR family transcriptional regulator